MGARRRLIALCVAALALLPACKRKEETPAPSPSATASADYLAPGEIPEGRERAFTLPLPLHSTVKARFAESVFVASSHTQDELSRFVRARVKDGTASSSQEEARFEKVVVKADPSKTLTIHVTTTRVTGGEHLSQILVKDVTPAPSPPEMTEEDRWKKAGLTPDGKLIDRQHLE